MLRSNDPLPFMTSHYCFSWDTKHTGKFPLHIVRQENLPTALQYSECPPKPIPVPRRSPGPVDNCFGVQTALGSRQDRTVLGDKHHPRTSHTSREDTCVIPKELTYSEQRHKLQCKTSAFSDITQLGPRFVSLSNPMVSAELGHRLALKTETSLEPFVTY